MSNRIEPWESTPSSLFPVRTLPQRRETLGTAVTYDGIILRTRGEYSQSLAEALIRAHDHMIAEGYKNV